MNEGRSLAQAVSTAVVLLGLIVVFYLLGTDAFFGLAFTVVVISLYELLDAQVRSGRRPSVPLGLAGAAGMMVVAYGERPAYLAVVLAITLVGAFVFALRPGRGESAASDAAWTLLGVAWIGGGGAGAVSILTLDDAGVELLIAAVLVIALDDIGAYFVGSKFGRHKMAPSISPAKSWEGFAGGLATSLLGGIVAGLLLDELRIIDGLAIGAIAGILAPVGDLVESVTKREIGIKDSGRLLPGHGGFLD
ncbi:MAG: phosphatidate cytidylyltransferase, partial [Actinomycetota bacterium]